MPKTLKTSSEVNLLKEFLRTSEIELWQTCWKIIPKSPENVDQRPITRLNFENFWKNVAFSKWSSGHLEQSFDDPAKACCQTVGEKWKTRVFPAIKLTNCSSGHVECSFYNLVEKFPPKVWKHFALNAKVTKQFYVFGTVSPENVPQKLKNAVLATPP